jgi:predicted MFS family arabinose efflux permease
MFFIVRELSTKTPLINIRVFRNGRYTLSLIITNILTISLYAGTLLAPVFLQKVQGVTAMDTGLLLLPSPFVMALVMPLAGKLYGRVGPRWLMSVGVIFLALGTLTLSWFSIDVSYLHCLHDDTPQYRCCSYHDSGKLRNRTDECRRHQQDSYRSNGFHHEY